MNALFAQAREQGKPDVLKENGQWKDPWYEMAYTHWYMQQQQAGGSAAPP